MRRMLMMLAALVLADADVVKEVEALEKKGALVHETGRDCENQFGSIDTWTDSRGVVRKLVHDFGSEDSKHTATQTYDASGAVRLLVVRVGAVPSVVIHARFEFDAKGRVVKKSRKVSGEGFAGYAATADEYLVKSPVEWLRTRRCVDK